MRVSLSVFVPNIYVCVCLYLYLYLYLLLFIYPSKAICQFSTPYNARGRHLAISHALVTKGWLNWSGSKTENGGRMHAERLVNEMVQDNSWPAGLCHPHSDFDRCSRLGSWCISIEFILPKFGSTDSEASAGINWCFSKRYSCWIHVTKIWTENSFHFPGLQLDPAGETSQRRPSLARVMAGWGWEFQRPTTQFDVFKQFSWLVVWNIFYFPIYSE